MKTPKLGDRILVKSSEERDIYYERIFLYKSNNKYCCVADVCEIDYHKGEDIHIVSWGFAKQIPQKKLIEYTLETFPLDNSGMIRMKGWEDRAFYTGHLVDDDGIYLRELESNTLSFKMAKQRLEWLNKDGTVSPFAQEIEE